MSDPCKTFCTCESETEKLLPDGRVNLGAFVAHVFCVQCKMDVDILEFDDGDVDIDGSDVAVAWHGVCQGCDKFFTLHVQSQDPDTPESEDTRTDAERAAAFNRRGR